jgi:hypothetical protein
MIRNGDVAIWLPSCAHANIYVYITRDFRIRVNTNKVRMFHCSSDETDLISPQSTRWWVTLTIDENCS